MKPLLNLKPLLKAPAWAVIFMATFPSWALTTDEIKLVPKLETGDVILRRGPNADSYFICTVSGSLYSHAGMVVVKEGEVLIIHATTDDDSAHPNQVILSTLDEFLSQALTAAVRRYPLTSAQQDEIGNFLFSMIGESFTLNGNKDDLYCTTLISRALSPYVDMSILPYDRLDLPIAGGWYLFPQRLMEDPRSALIYPR